MSKWSKNELIYQIYPQSFFDANGDGVGDISGITAKLDYLAWLGVGAIWICPMYDSPNRDNGYDVRNYEKLQARYGTDGDFDELVAQAHKRGIKVIMDLVLNHTSDENLWFLESAASRDGDKADWYIWRDPKPDGSAPTNWGAIFGNAAWTYCPARKQYYLNTFSPYQPDLNWESESLKAALYAIVNRWIARGVDGFRLDAINFIAKDLSPLRDGKPLASGYADIYPFVANQPEVHRYLAELKSNTFAKADCLTVGEASSATVEDAVAFAGELDMIFQFEHVAMDVDNDWRSKPVDIVTLKKTFAKWQRGLYGKARNTLFWENHDQPRIVTRMGDEGALRERSAKMLAVCMYFMQGTPFVYQGQELGMVNTRFGCIEEVRDIEVRNAYKRYVAGGLLTEEEFFARISRRCRDTSRTPMCWDGGKNGGFSGAEPWIKVNERYRDINVEEQLPREDSCLNFYKRLFALRSRLTVVADGHFTLAEQDDSRVVAYYRQTDSVRIVVVCNMTGDEVFYDRAECDGEVLLCNVPDSVFRSAHRLAPYEAIVIKLRRSVR